MCGYYKHRFNHFHVICEYLCMFRMFNFLAATTKPLCLFVVVISSKIISYLFIMLVKKNIIIYSIDIDHLVYVNMWKFFYLLAKRLWALFFSFVLGELEIIMRNFFFLFEIFEKEMSRKNKNRWKKDWNGISRGFI